MILRASVLISGVFSRLLVVEICKCMTSFNVLQCLFPFFDTTKGVQAKFVHGGRAEMFKSTGHGGGEVEKCLYCTRGNVRVRY